MMLGETPFMATHLSGDTAWVDVLFVPYGHRRAGRGRTMFERWEHALPPKVANISVLAVVLDGESPIGFWKKMGFEVVEEDYMPEVEGLGCRMKKSLAHPGRAAVALSAIGT